MRTDAIGSSGRKPPGCKRFHALLNRQLTKLVGTVPKKNALCSGAGAAKGESLHAPADGAGICYGSECGPGPLTDLYRPVRLLQALVQPPLLAAGTGSQPKRLV